MNDIFYVDIIVNNSWQNKIKFALEDKEINSLNFIVLKVTLIENKFHYNYTEKVRTHNLIHFF